MEMPKPTEAHKKLAGMAGKWTGQEHMHPSPWDPAGGPATGRCDNRMALDGFALLHDYVQERNGAVSFRGHGVLTYDTKENCYVMHWWDSMGCGVNIFKGAFAGDTLTLSRSEERGQSRVVWKFPGNGTYQFRMEMSPDGTQWHPAMDGDYKAAN
jgi:Protein of unknown function (DUF1579)